MDDFGTILQSIESIGYVGVFIFLFLRERADHKQTREDYRQDLRDFARTSHPSLPAAGKPEIGS